MNGETHYLACQGCGGAFPLDSSPLGEPCDLCGGQLVETPAAADRYGYGERHEPLQLKGVGPDANAGPDCAGDADDERPGRRDECTGRAGPNRTEGANNGRSSRGGKRVADR